MVAREAHYSAFDPKLLTLFPRSISKLSKIKTAVSENTYQELSNGINFINIRDTHYSTIQHFKHLLVKKENIY